MKRDKRNKRIKEFMNRAWPALPPEVVAADCAEVWKRLQPELAKVDTSLWSLEGDGWSAEPTNQREFQVLTAISQLGERSDIHAITATVEQWTRRNMIVSVYDTLRRLEDRQLIAFHRTGPAVDGGEPPHYYSLSKEGDRALRRAHAEGKELVSVREECWSLRLFVKEALRIKS